MKACSLCEKLSLAHVSSDVFLRMDDTCFKLALDCIRARLDHGKSGKFEAVRTDFYNEVPEMYEALKPAAVTYDKSVINILQLKIRTTRALSVTVSDKICREMVIYGIDKERVKEEPTLERMQTQRGPASSGDDLLSKIGSILSPGTAPPQLPSSEGASAAGA